MDFLNRFQDLFKRQLPKSDTVEALFERKDLNQFFAGLNNLWAPSELIKKIGGIHKLPLLYKDDQIYAAVDKRIAALLDTRLVIDGGDASIRQFMIDQIMPHERQLKQDFWWTVAYGYGVEQIIYNEDRSGRVEGFQREDFWRFEPAPDLILVRLVYSNNAMLVNKQLEYGKWVLTTNNGTASNPFGDAMFERLITPWIFRCTGWDLWIDFAKRFANGFLHAKIADETQKSTWRKALEKAGKSSVLVTGLGDEVNLLQASRDSSLYKDLDDKTVAAIQRVILGETLTSAMAERGSSGAATIHNEVRLEKTRSDIALVESAINEVMTQIAAVNGFTGEIPKAKLIYDPGLNQELATRDTTLHSQGIRFNKKYYENNYGLKDDEFEIVEAQSGFPSFSQKKKSTFLTPEDIKNFIGGSDVSDKGHKCKPLNLNANISRKDRRQENEKEEVVAYLNRNESEPIDMDDLFAAISMAENEKDLEKNLIALFDQRNNGFVDTMTDALYYAATKGALLGNPEKLTESEIETAADPEYFIDDNMEVWTRDGKGFRKVEKT